MPFTFSHPAIVLPLLKKKYDHLFSATGLIVGSIAPDFEAFIRFGKEKTYGHNWVGAFWFDLPLALFISFVFHLFVRQSLIENLPRAWRERFEFARTFDWIAYFQKNIIVVILSLLIGVFSHLLWDSFTHLNLHNPNSFKSNIWFHGFRVFILLQYICSALGLLAIFAFSYELPRMRIKQIKYNKIKFWCYILLIAGIIFSYVYTEANENDAIDKLFIVNVAMGAGLSAVLFVSMVERLSIWIKVK
ncbi:DUF4184 domain-containing protein [Flavipsychrobacter stenotrophus]|uniref:DUF4184 domain-containing protein n=1 Tax=Flavipsychrobacter stenotrophus TaxID=2077091 RepID=A0A2S7T2D1_9BACT|nr:DUF4184 family protein [Flavipsychrobacter stenotrophus]PQJ13114.1 DUF4184 domain-containing protein [Flavipsychrobacter stenotrophus]